MNVNFPNASSQKVAPLWLNDYTLADEGGYYTGCNPAVGTAIATTTSVVDDAATASATHAQFAPVALWTNQENPNNQNAVSIYLRYLKMFLVQVPTSATSWRYSLRLDTIPRYSSAGTVVVPQNVNPASTKSSKCQFVFGAIVPLALPSASGGRLLANGLINSVIPVTLDQWLFTFGNASPSMDQLNGGAAAKNIVINAPPIVIPPGCCLALDMWGAANAAAPSWEFECGWAERVPGL